MKGVECLGEQELTSNESILAPHLRDQREKVFMARENGEHMVPLVPKSINRSCGVVPRMWLWLPLNPLEVFSQTIALEPISEWRFGLQI